MPIIIVALVTMKFCGATLDIQPSQGRFAAIDGLRGYMAFFVFIYHSCLWYFLMHGYGWGAPPSHLYSHFGSTSVSVFFMITSFLFFNKLLEARGRNMDWLKLYIARALRIVPLYFFSVLALLLIVGLLTRFQLRTSVGELLWGILKWLAFIQTNLNNVFPTSRIVAGVVWSLPFEWMFYCTLPLLGLALRIRASALTLILALIGLVFSILVIDEFYPVGGWIRASPFLGGMTAACLIRNKWVKKVAPRPLVSICMIAALVLIVEFFPSIYTPIPLTMMTFVFTAISGGNSLFGILTHRLSRTLGQISYSIYLLHGIVLFVAFTRILGPHITGRLSPLEHWGVIALCGGGVVWISSLTYRFIERPAMDAASAITQKIKKDLASSKKIVLSNEPYRGV